VGLQQQWRKQDEDRSAVLIEQIESPENDKNKEEHEEVEDYAATFVLNGDEEEGEDEAETNPMKDEEQEQVSPY
jgi:hypothetical protein